jgi:large subunit ribosomal protein L32e
MDAKELLKKRRLLKRKKPDFMKQDCHKKVRLSESWRKPRGSDSKMRVSRRGYRRIVKAGWGSPTLVKGLDRNGLMPMTVSNMAELEGIDPKIHSVVISSGVGTKKKLELIEKALSKNMTISNYKAPEKVLAETKEKIEEKKKQKEQLKKEREKKKEAAKKEAEKKKKEEEEKAEKEKQDKEKDKDKETAAKEAEEKKKEEKKEQDKVLISTQ